MLKIEVEMTSAKQGRNDGLGGKEAKRKSSSHNQSRGKERVATDGAKKRRPRVDAVTSKED